MKTDQVRLESNRRWRARNAAWVADYKREWRARHPERDRAHREVRRAVRRGVLARPEVCQGCGARSAVQAHHDDYADPLGVVWVCSGCHAGRHPDRH